MNFGKVIQRYWDLVQQYRNLNIFLKLGVWGAVASIVGLLFYLFPLSSSLTTKTLTQADFIRIEDTGDLEVYYPVPYKSPPKLTWPETDWGLSRSSFSVEEQRKDGFKLSVSSYSSSTKKLRWKAEGIPAN